MQIELLKTFREQVRGMPKAHRRAVTRAIDTTHAGFGKPHLHSGQSIRRLRQNYFECRVGLDIRLAFRIERGRMIFVAAGNHDEIRKLIKTL